MAPNCGLIGGKFGGIDHGSRSVLLLSAVNDVKAEVRKFHLRINHLKCNAPGDRWGYCEALAVPAMMALRLTNKRD